MIERWIAQEQRRGESPRVDAFLQDIIEICRRHGLAVTPSDPLEGIEVVLLDEAVSQRLLRAADYTYRKTP